MTNRLRKAVTPVRMNIERLKTLQEEVQELAKMWKLVQSYEERSFITGRISKMQTEALGIMTGLSPLR